MIKSRISRSIIVLVFVVFMCMFEIYCVGVLINSSNIVNNNGASVMEKVCYVFFLVLLTTIYILFKDKLYRKKVKRKISLVYRYIYIIFAVILSTLFSINDGYATLSNKYIIFYVIFSVGISLIVKKIIFNISKSDILSVLALFAYSMLPNIINDSNMLLYSMLVSLFMSAFILALQFFIDELKQIGIKTKKYLVESIIAGIFAGISTLLGINILVFILLGILLLFITNELDSTHISFPKLIMRKINRENRERLYGIERINISKLFIGIVIILIVTLLINFIGSIVIEKKISSESLINSFRLQSSFENIDSFNNVFFNIKGNVKAFVNLSKTFYLILIAYILFVEMLAFVLKRKYDTKSTAIKIIFLLLFFIISVFNMNLLAFQPLFSIMLIIISIINTSNIYLNREERIKMLVA